MPRRKFDILQWCADNRGRQALDSNVQYEKQATGGNDPSITKAMRYSQYVRNAKPHGTTITRTPTTQSSQPQLLTASLLG
jgi:4-aminobutyrate aminotransferase-like enzyme